jgi:hypothetical protein
LVVLDYYYDIRFLAVHDFKHPSYGFVEYTDILLKLANQKEGEISAAEPFRLDKKKNKNVKFRLNYQQSCESEEHATWQTRTTHTVDCTYTPASGNPVTVFDPLGPISDWKTITFNLNFSKEKGKKCGEKRLICTIERTR